MRRWIVNEPTLNYSIISQASKFDQRLLNGIFFPSERVGVFAAVFSDRNYRGGRALLMIHDILDNIE